MYSSLAHETPDVHLLNSGEDCQSVRCHYPHAVHLAPRTSRHFSNVSRSPGEAQAEREVSPTGVQLWLGAETPESRRALLIRSVLPLNPRSLRPVSKIYSDLGMGLVRPRALYRMT